MLQKLFVRSITLYLTLVTSAFACELQVTDPWVREAPPTATALAGYMVLKNPGDEKCVLKAVRAEGFNSAMFHRTEHKGGMAHMAHQGQVVVPAGGQLVFEPNGFHIMLMQPSKPLHEGDRVAVTLVGAGGGEQTVDFPVRKSPPVAE